MIANLTTSRAATVLRLISLALVLAALVFAALSAMRLIFRENPSTWEIIRGVQTPVVGVLAGAIGMLCANSIARRRYRWLMWCNAALVFGVTAYWVAFMWLRSLYDSGAGEMHIRLLVTLSLAVLGLTITGQFLAQSGSPGLLSTMRIAMAIWVDVFLGFVITLLWSDWWLSVEREVITFSVIAGFMTFVGVVLFSVQVRSVNRQRAHARESIAERVVLKLTCPTCCEVQTLRRGLRRCGACGFAMLIEVEEPRCACGYLLYQLQGDVCPECGRPVEVLNQQSSAAGQDRLC